MPLEMVKTEGLLPDSCYSAKIIDKYPGGNIQYSVDPGEAQVFIEETIDDNCVICKKPLIPWTQSVEIKDEKHTMISIFVNQKKELTVEIDNDLPEFGVFNYGFNPFTCYIHPYDFPKTQETILKFGPASYEECLQWKKENCNK